MSDNVAEKLIKIPGNRILARSGICYLILVCLTRSLVTLALVFCLRIILYDLLVYLMVGYQCGLRVLWLPGDTVGKGIGAIVQD